MLTDRVGDWGTPAQQREEDLSLRPDSGSFFSVANESLIRDTETLSQQYLIGTAPLMRVFGSRPRTGTSLATEEM